MHMRYVATFVAAAAARPLDDGLDEALLGRLARHLPGAEAWLWLAPGIAADVTFSGSEPALTAITAKLYAELGGRPIDLIVQPQATRRKKLLLADMDSTVIGQECIDELADTIGLKAQVAKITERAMRGDIAFEPALRARVALLKGLDIGVIAQVLAVRIRPTQGAAVLVRTMRAHGAYTALVSGGFSLFARAIADQIGFDEAQANELIVEAGRLAGVREPVLGQSAKGDALLALRAARGLAQHETLAVGDGANDLAMLREAGLGIAYHAKPAVAAAAAARIDHGDLTAVLYAQGYTRAEFHGTD